jgi:hypothetical protein
LISRGNVNRKILEDVILRLPSGAMDPGGLFLHHL